MLVGFANMIARVWEDEEPRTVFVGFDSIGAPTYRHELLPEYQSGRDFPPVLTYQLDRLPELVGALGFPWAKADGYEADDFLGAAVAAEEARKGETLVLTNDRDLFQLASSKTTILRPRTGLKDSSGWAPTRCRRSTACAPALVPDFVALRGDPSDKIPGAKGIGPGRAASILAKYGSLEACLEAGGFPDQADALRDYLRMARLQADVADPRAPRRRARLGLGRRAHRVLGPGGGREAVRRARGLGSRPVSEPINVADFARLAESGGSPATGGTWRAERATRSRSATTWRRSSACSSGRARSWTSAT